MPRWGYGGPGLSRGWQVSAWVGVPGRGCGGGGHDLSGAGRGLLTPAAPRTASLSALLLLRRQRQGARGQVKPLPLYFLFFFHVHIFVR